MAKYLTDDILPVFRDNFVIAGKDTSLGNRPIRLVGNIIDWGFLQLITTNEDAEVSIGFTKNSSSHILNIGVPTEVQLPGCSKKFCVYDATNAYGYGNRWLCFATEEYVNGRTAKATIQDIQGLWGGLKSLVKSIFKGVKLWQIN